MEGEGGGGVWLTPEEAAARKEAQKRKAAGDDEDGEKKRHKKHKERKHSKHRHKHHRRSSSSSPDTDPAADAQPPLPAPEPPRPDGPGSPGKPCAEPGNAGAELGNACAGAPAAAQRESWMTAPPPPSAGALALARAREEEAQQRAEREREEAERQQSATRSRVRELNPYWAAGGEGLPPASAGAEGDAQGAAGVGDGGAGWRARALTRARERAREEGRQLDDVVRERWESVAELEKAAERERASRGRPGTRPGDRDREQRSGRRGGGPQGRAYLQDSAPVMRQPEVSGDLRWSHSHSHSPAAEPAPGGPGEEESQRGPESRKRPAEDEPPAAAPPEQRQKQSEERPADADAPESSAPARQPEEQPPAAAAEQREAQPPRPALDPNALAAQALKAKLMGKMDEYERLQALAESARTQQRAPAGSSREPDEAPGSRRVVTLPSYDERGRKVEVRRAEDQMQLRDKQAAMYDKAGNRVRYFADDDEARDASELLARERAAGGARSYDEQLARQIMKQSTFRSSELFGGAGGDYDEEQLMTEDGPRKMSRRNLQRSEERQRRQAIQAHNAAERKLAQCSLCLDSSAGEGARGLVVSHGETVYLSLPQRGSLVEGHCVLVPTQHTTAMRAADEDVVREVEAFKSALVRMFRAQGKGVLFMETATNFKRSYHTFVDVVPLPRHLADEGPLYFKQSIMGSDTEWAQHKKLIDTRGRGLHRSIPKDFPYFFVDFNGEGGFVHVVEDEGKFPHYFGRSVVAGMLELGPESYLKPRRSSPQEEAQAVQRFARQWEQARS
eukprot:m51a1_g1846 hypothetical protein (790) ;mRNA; f:583903-586342